MALIKCPECDHDVSEFAENCPNCGYKIAKQNEVIAKLTAHKKSNSIPTFLIFIFLSLALISIIPLWKSMSEIPRVKSMVGVCSALVNAGELPFDNMSYSELEEHKGDLKTYSKELSSLEAKRNLSIVLIVVSLISMCICFLIIKNNDKYNETIRME